MNPRARHGRENLRVLPPRPIRAWALLLPALLIGCDAVPRKEYDQVKTQLAQSREEARKSAEADQALQAKVREQQSQIDSLLALGHDQGPR